MKDKAAFRVHRAAAVALGLVLAFSGLAGYPAGASALQLNVVGPQGEPVSSYRWLVEEDTTYHVIPGLPDAETLAVNFHSSYMPVVAKGDETTPPTSLSLDPAKHYYVSILPNSGYTIGGAQVGGGQGAVTVVVNTLPLPTAQITVFVFEDMFPINNAPDLPAETGLEGFTVVVEDAGGRYGMSAGMQMLDAFGNPLGTTYQRDVNGDYLLDGDGMPIVEMMGDGVLYTDAEGMVTIKNLSPGKYGIQAIAPTGTDWVQTSTIEGTRVIDAWVKANEPPFFQEFGPPGFHVFIGFVRPFTDAAVLDGGSTVSGQVVNLHMSRPPDYAFYNGAPLEHTTPWVGLNLGAAGDGRGVHAAPCNADGTFAIPNVPPGDYQLVVWDEALDIIFAFHQVTVNPDGSCATFGGSCDMGEVPVFQWFTRLENYVFNDENENGFPDPGEMPISEQNVNIRWRDGTVYQAVPTDVEGMAPFDQVFPFFSWLVAEVDFARFKATGVTVVVDDGGAIPLEDPIEAPWTFDGKLNPQPQSVDDPVPGQGAPYEGAPFRTETGPVLTQAFQGFLGQTSALLWGKKAYGPDENGGISGMVFYSTTRAEDDPRYGAAEPWEPGIPGVTVNLYDGTGSLLLNTTSTDSWDADQPAGCKGEPFVFMGTPRDCYDGLRNFNQVRPGVFDGGYAFDSYCADLGGMAPDGSCAVMVDGLLPGPYIVEVIPPAGYEIVKEEDRNVDFGDEYVPSTLLLPPVCAGDPHLVPAELSLFPGVPAFYAGEERPLCDRKLIYLRNGQNAAADFFLFTEVPIAGHIIGFILDDTANEFDPASPQFGEKFAPPWLPVSIRDYTGREIGRTYSDQYGVYNALVPSTYTANRPAPSGMSPNMLTTCMNDPVLPDGTPDPFFNSQYSTFCYTFQYMPGATTYLDTPVVPVAAFAGADQFPLDCEPADGTPVVNRVTGPGNGVGGGPFVNNAGEMLVITSAGPTFVPNPAYDGPGGIAPKLILRDYGFGPGGTVTIGGVPLTSVSWTPSMIVGLVGAGTSTGDLVVTRSDSGLSSIAGATVTVGLARGQGVWPVMAGGSIQAAIDAAGVKDLILVGPGTYNEMVIMWKPVRLQGWGAPSTIINAVKAPAEKLVAWRAKVQALVENGDVDLLPGQEQAFGGIEPATLFAEEGAGVLVLARRVGPTSFGLVPNRGARIDGFTITSADTGGGIVANGYADYLEISNNRISNNSGFYGGGIRLGHPFLVVERPDGIEYQDANNDRVRIHRNMITQNGGLGGAGGGVSICTGSDYYRLNDNFICGNLTLGDGGGVGHLGLSDRGSMLRNTVIFNESFNQGVNVSGGGILIAGGASPVPGELSPGSGIVRVVGNLIQGNLAGAGDGGGIATLRVNGQDVSSFRNDSSKWHNVRIVNNMIVDNVAALAGAGISLQDTARVIILHNTVANNDSTATAGSAFTPGNPNESLPQPAGIVSRAHSPELEFALSRSNTDSFSGFSRPRLVNNIIWHNRSFHFFGDPDADPPVYGLLPDVTVDPPVYDDMAVLGTPAAEQLDPRFSLLTDVTGYRASNITGDPLFAAEYVNGDRGASITIPEITTAIQAPAAFDEGGNFIRVRFGPLTQTIFDEVAGEWVLRGDYHITAGSPAVGAARDLDARLVRLDYDGEPRPEGPAPDIGADELYP